MINPDIRSPLAPDIAVYASGFYFFCGSGTYAYLCNVDGNNGVRLNDLSGMPQVLSIYSDASSDYVCYQIWDLILNTSFKSVTAINRCNHTRVYIYNNTGGSQTVCTSGYGMYGYFPT